MAKHIYKKSGPPTFAPPQIGHHYIDTLNRNLYISVGISVPSDWILINAVTPSVQKAGRLLVSDFSGSPKSGTVTFSSSIATPYAVNISGVDTRVWSVESISSTGFVINSNANLSLTGDVYWEVQQDGEF